VAKLSAAVLLVAVATVARAEWVATHSETEPGFVAGVEHRQLVFENTQTGARAIVDLAVFVAKSFVTRSIDNPNAETALAGAMIRAKCVAGVNGGYFDEQFAPVGLLIVDGNTTVPLQRARLLTGVLLATPRGMQLRRTRELSAHPDAQSAVQAGPFLIDGGKPVSGLESSREARRAFAATAGTRAALGSCSEISLAQLAAILATAFNDLKIQRALNLDGGSSSAFWFKRRDGTEFSIPEEKPVRDFIGVAAK
jgi:Phosphodiester glycosidase